ncbi:MULTISPECIES: DNA-methyltransferase [Acetomicrobium]|uniref:DNA-methyltransferase n=1 Tax=Acetomicrobium TaxID=49894 RepID=UPI0026EF421D|nr:site-specific DNA-methyltransferase [Acetomicrobium mobile]HOB10657.1 site-specific DNA-methyltransferase [Acetomicrobium sp.]
MTNLLYNTDYGEYYIGECESEIKKLNLKGKVQLILTSPPFPLNNKKQYGNKVGDEYLNWFINLAPLFAEILTENGSVVVEMGNAWESGRPVQSLLHMKSLIGFIEKANLRLCQEFICYNPARLPSPAQWVTIERIRVIDSFTHIWWMSKSDYPKADNRNVLRPYSKSMKKLLKKGKYNAGKRPSSHVIGKKSFLKDNEGSICRNVLELEPIEEDENVRLPYSMFKIANTKSNDFFMRKCKERDIVPHPARMPLELASFFIEFLTDEGDLVLDPFSGSNTTGFCAERLKRKWVSIEANTIYGYQSMIRFEEPSLCSNIKRGEICNEYYPRDPKNGFS